METSIQEQAHAGIEVVNARLNYLGEATAKPINYDNVFVERVLPSSRHLACARATDCCR